MLFYDYFRSSACYRVRLALALKGHEVERVFVSLRRGEQAAAAYRAVNPQGLVPAVVDDGRRLTQSTAIIEYLDARWPQPPLLPADAFGRARVRGLAALIACDIHPLNNLRILKYLEDEMKVKTEAVTGRWYLHWIAEGLAAFEAILERDADTGRFCHGNQPTMADIFLIPQLFNAERYGANLTEYKNILRIKDNCDQMEAFQAAHPSRQPDAE